MCLPGADTEKPDGGSVPYFGKKLPGYFVDHFCRIGRGRERSLTAVSGEIISDNRNSDNTDISFCGTDPCPDSFTQGEQDISGGIFVRDIKSSCDGISKSFGRDLVICNQFKVMVALVVISVLGTGKQNVILSLGIVFIPSFVRIVRGEFIRLRDAEYIKNARLMGVSSLRIMFVHILPNIMPTFIVSLTVGINNAILAESGMSYLGIGVQPPDASLGKMLSDAQGYLFNAPWYALAPGITIVIIVLGVSLIGEGLRK